MIEVGAMIAKFLEPFARAELSVLTRACEAYDESGWVSEVEAECE